MKTGVGSDPGGGGLPHSSYTGTGMCHPKGSCFWVFDLEGGLMFKPISRTGF